MDEAGNTSAAASFQVNIDKIAPVISASAKKADNTNYVADTWTNQSVTVTFTCTDAGGSGVGSFTDPITFTATGTHQANGSCSDTAGNGDSTSFGPVKIDKIAPTLAISGKLHGTSTNYVSGSWTNQDVDVSFDCNDTGGSGPKASSVPANETRSATKSYSETCMDEAGNTSAAASFQVNIDKIAPVISASAKKADNTNYAADTWTSQSVTVTFTCTDAGGSGVGSFTNPITFSTDSATHQANGFCSDTAGNGDSTSFGPVKIDKTSPNIGVTDNNAASYTVCGGAARPSKPVFSPSDGLSGLDGSEGETWITPGTPNGVGMYTYSAHAQDRAGNTISYGPKNYLVLYGAAVAQVPYLQPINVDGTSRFKLGSTIPVKFQALCNGVPVGNLVAKMYVKQGDSQPDPGVDEAISTAASTTGNLFRFTGSPDNQYIFNLSTKLGYVNPSPESAINNFGQGTWTLKIGLDDGTFRSVNIQLVK